MSDFPDDAYDARQVELGDRLADAETEATMLRREVTCGIRVDTANPGHTMLSVFVGRIEGARGHAGNLVIRTEEWEELCKRFINPRGKLVIEFDAMAPLMVKYQDGTPVAFDGIEARRAPGR